MKTLILAIAVLSVSLTGCAVQYPYPDGVRNVAVGACEQGGGSASYCECFVRWLQNNVPYSQFVYYDAQLRSGAAIPTSWYPGIKSCV